jgi:hypothetical protein
MFLDANTVVAEIHPVENDGNNVENGDNVENNHEDSEHDSNVVNGHDDVRHDDDVKH